MMYPSCKLCHAATEWFHHAKIGDFYHCTSCEFISKDESQRLSENAERRQYDRHNNSIEDPRYVAFFYRFLEDAVFPYVGEGKRGFDFGSGPSPVLAQILTQYHGYDMDIYDAFYAPNKVYQGKQYDLITCTEVAEHLRDPIGAFRLFVELLAPNGVLCLMTLFHNNQESDFINWHYMRDWTHISFYTPKTLEYLAEEVGLKLIHTDNHRYSTFKLKASNPDG